MKVLTVLSIVLGLLGVAIVGTCRGNEDIKRIIIAQKKVSKDTVPRATSLNKVVIGVLNFSGRGYLTEELRRNTRVKVVNIPESCELSDLKKNGYELAEKYRIDYQLDIILHINIVRAGAYYFNLIDLYRKRSKEISFDADRFGTQNITPIEIRFRGISSKLLSNRDLDRILRAKREAFEIKETVGPREVKEDVGIKETAVPKEVKESPTAIEDLIQEGPKLIVEGQYNSVLDLIEDLPAKSRRNIQIQILACFANLKGWVKEKNQYYKMNWWTLRQRLIKSGNAEATPILVTFLRDEDPYMRLYAADLLGHIGDKRALEDLRKAGANDKNYRVRRYAKWAYEQISGEKF